MTTHSEFTVANDYRSNQRSPLLWVLSHLWRHKLAVAAAVGLSLTFHLFYSQGSVMIGRAAQEIVEPSAPNGLLLVGLATLAVFAISSVADLLRSWALEILAKGLERGARQELYTSLLGKSQTFHDRQRVGDIMAMATDDTQALSDMISPGVLFIFDILLGFAVPILFIAMIELQLLITPALFVLLYVISVNAYAAKLNPIANSQREQYGKMNAVAEETISGIEIVKASAQEAFERVKFENSARRFRELFVRQGFLEARYLPLLIFGIVLGLGLLHGVWLVTSGQIDIAEMIAFIGLFNLLRFPTFASLFTWSLVQIGLAGAGRILRIIKAETELDQNVGGHTASLRGEIVFDNVSFGYEDGVVLQDISFHIQPGQTVAIVGQTGSGKTTLTELINRVYDVTAGRVLIDGVDVREWNLTALRSQISKIEQDVFLFSRSLADNIAFGAPNATREQIEHAAREAQAHDFITSFTDGYETVVGERGVTLSGGQRQRIALARAFLSDPRILILDDSTSAIDSATEDEIQRAIRRAQEGRTTLLITHRLSQIRWADHILVLDRGRLVASGSHEQLLRRSAHYRRIFARYDVSLPPLEEGTNENRVVPAEDAARVSVS